ncbi:MULTISPECIES: type II secretion system protein [unclassified Fibrobacter]|uniref:type IV pilin protein n=1 Tax=unclassified Fibrobacter TaxID=2634177 RepID=UPI0025BD1427|nr:MULTISPECIES: type II secretion system protein [unclassified Fibrobacter]
MKKQGFTLIELMVVIVIMGILAAVAVPKLFGMIAKSKASEVGPAAGTYVHLQDSYYAEMNAVGTGTQIGYNAPASNTFTYDAATAGTWTATSKSDLNECGTGSVWTVTSAPASGGVSHTATTPSGKPACEALTPSFTQIGAATHN